MIFHPSLVQAGDRYEKSNLRLHYYAISTTEEFDPNSTYHFDPVLSNGLHVLARNMKNAEGRKIAYQDSLEREVKRYEARCTNLVTAREALAVDREAKKNK